MWIKKSLGKNIQIKHYHIFYAIWKIFSFHYIHKFNKIIYKKYQNEKKEKYLEFSNIININKNLVINELERTNKRLDMIDKRLAHIEKHIAVLQTKAATYAAGVALIISGGITLLFRILWLWGTELS